MQVVHITTVHPRDDARIFHKMCCSCVRHGYSVQLIVADGKRDDVVSGVTIVDVGPTLGRLHRARIAADRAFRKAMQVNADIYHLHDPELIPVGLKLKRAGKTVVFDSHEDIPKQLLTKSYLNRPLRLVLSRAWSSYERWATKRLDGVIGATPNIRDKFRRFQPRTVDIRNFPLLDELHSGGASGSEKRQEVCYIGSISKSRGIHEIVEAMELAPSDVQLNLCGRMHDRRVESDVKRQAGWSRVHEMGFVDREGVREVLARSVAGLVTLHPTASYVEALPVKMFEYMSAGVPVIASDFPHWRAIISEHNCGLLVNPLCPREIAAAIDYVVSHPKEARQMGENGRKAVTEQFNWQAEEGRLIQFYGDVLS